MEEEIRIEKKTASTTLLKYYWQIIRISICNFSLKQVDGVFLWYSNQINIELKIHLQAKDTAMLLG
jgi:hypothetical protein